MVSGGYGFRGFHLPALERFSPLVSSVKKYLSCSAWESGVLPPPCLSLIFCTFASSLFRLPARTHAEKNQKNQENPKEPREPKEPKGKRREKDFEMCQIQLRFRS